ncbi:AAA family ATPase [Nocardioides agariphilus]|uniref:AAA family ATPase n=1 Tax=Nocardioides agariphilus TaxID=433664 RepID=A0A930VK26_9ACTN|nr:AAA family ATPase [Nocardioides agariphilus]
MSETQEAFCGSCGTALAVGCRTCQAPLTAGQRFCTRCGTPVNVEDDVDPAVPVPETERRLCSLLFVDLVGFTPLSEGRDPEEVRELLSDYFALARRVVGRYGAVIEKFIGDAVMAVWGTPVATEGDAERSVRAALDLVAAVAEMGVRLDAPGLTARAGVVTGTVATTPGADGQAMVAGDPVNTAARVQSAAPPGAVLVDVTTRRLVGPAIDLEPFGDLELKGKSQPETLWRARQVVSGMGGAQRADGLEGPFVGRSTEFTVLKDRLHATIEHRSPGLVLVTGAPGVGKSRLGWELEKYVDGLADAVFWHRGRCPTFGEDTAYWALTEMVRARLGIGEDDDLSTVEEKLAQTLDRLFDDPADQALVADRLAPLLGLPVSRDGHPQAELFAGWRTFFEGLARQQPVLLVIEDLHDADEGLLDFVEHLVAWVRDLPVLVIGFARPELLERRPGLGDGRHRTALALSPLDETAMLELLAGLVDHLPGPAAAAIQAHAQGIPLFAVETVRSLIDQQVVVATGEGYSLAGDLGTLDVPDSLQSLLAARLDALDPVARSLAGDAAVIAAPFTVETMTAVSSLTPAQVAAGLAELARRDVLVTSADALSPQLGSFGYSHGLLAQVAYQTLSRKDLKERHLRVARHLDGSARNEGDALAELVAQHHVRALRARPHDPDVPALREEAVHWLGRAGERAATTGAPASAARLYATAAELAEEDGTETGALAAAGFWMRSGHASLALGDGHAIIAAASRAADLRARHGRTREVALAQVLRGRGLFLSGRADEARTLMLAATAELEAEPGVDTVAAMADALAPFSMSGLDAGEELTERALVLAQQLGVTGPHWIDLLIHRALVLATRDRRAEAATYLREALRLAELADDPLARARALLNLGDAVTSTDPAECLRLSLQVIELARLTGGHYWLLYGTSNGVLAALVTGDWDIAAGLVEGALEDDALIDVGILVPTAAIVWALRGKAEQAHALLVAMQVVERDAQESAYLDYAWAVVLEAEGDLAGTLEHAQRSAETSMRIGLHSDIFRMAWPLAARAAHANHDDAATKALLAMLEGRLPGEFPPVVRAELALAGARALPDADARTPALAAALTLARSAGSPYHLAQALLDVAEDGSSTEADPDRVDPAVAEALAIGEALGSPLVIGRARALAAR